MYTVYIYIYIHSPATLLGTPVQLLGNTNCKPIRWQQLNAFRHLDVVKTTCWSSKPLLVYRGFSRTTISRVYREWYKKRENTSERQLCEQKCLVDVRGQREWVDWLEMIEGNSNSNNHLLQPSYAEYHLWTYNTSNPEADGLQQQKTHRCRSCPAKTGNGGLQFTQATKLDISSLDSCCNIQMVSQNLA